MAEKKNPSPQATSTELQIEVVSSKAREPRRSQTALSHQPACSSAVGNCGVKQCHFSQFCSLERSSSRHQKIQCHVRFCTFLLSHKAEGAEETNTAFTEQEIGKSREGVLMSAL